MILRRLHKQKPPTLFVSSVSRSLRMWWGTLPANRWQLMREWVWQRRWRLAGVASVAMVIVFLFLLTHLDECPVTGRTRLLVFNRESYMELAVLTSEEVRGGSLSVYLQPDLVLFMHTQNKMREVKWNSVSVTENIPKMLKCVFVR